MGDSNMRHIENIIGTKLPEDFKDFLKTNGGLSHYERYFIDSDKTVWEVNRYLAYQDLFKLTEEFLESYKRKLVPFAFDMGGWHFCLCLDEGSDYGSIVINRWSDYLPEEQFIAQMKVYYQIYHNGQEVRGPVQLNHSSQFEISFCNHVIWIR